MSLLKVSCQLCGTGGYATNEAGLVDTGWSFVPYVNGDGGAWRCWNCVEQPETPYFYPPIPRGGGQARGRKASQKNVLHRFLLLAWDLEMQGTITQELVEIANHLAATISCAVDFPNLRWDGSTWNGSLAAPDNYEAM